MNPGILVPIAYVVCSAVHCGALAASNHRIAAVTKPMLMPILVAFYLLSSTRPDILVVFALTAGFLGDVFLLKKGSMLAAGILSFFAGHLFYITKLVGSVEIDFFQNRSAEPYSFALLLQWFFPLFIFASYGVFIAGRLKPHTGRWILPLVPYVSALLATGYFACLYFITFQNTKGAMVLAGALFFIASDTMLSYELFIRDRKWRNVAVMATYTMAQGLLAAGLL